MRIAVRLKFPLAAVFVVGLLFVVSPIEAAQNVYVKNYTPLLSLPSEQTGKPLKNLALNEVVTVVYTEEALGVTDLTQTWVRVRYDDLEGWVYGGFLSSSGYTMSSDSRDKPLILPIDPSQYRRTSKYGPRTHPINKSPSFHSGVDLAAPAGTPIYAAGDGVIEVQNDNTGYGLLTVIRHENGLVSYHAHQSRRHRTVGARVTAGELIGEVGTTGNSTGNHLHFEVRTNYNDAHFNPDLYVPFPEAEEVE